MATVTRRGLLMKGSLGVAAIGVLSALPTLTFAQAASDGQPNPPRPTPLDASMVMPTAGGTPFMVYVNDPSSGSGTILIGEQAIPFNDPNLVQVLERVIGS